MVIADAELLTGAPRARVNWTSYLLVLPTLAFLGVFFIYPMAQAISLAVTDPQSGALTWVHLRRMSSDLYFGRAVRFTLIITAIAVPLQVALGLDHRAAREHQVSGRTVTRTPYRRRRWPSSTGMGGVSSTTRGVEKGWGDRFFGDGRPGRRSVTLAGRPT
ncbi:MAG: hypothetical protein AUI83_01180 [Armatimonadetes bacterium 13_1_40CM_3_65_7]|nr:MAG: hypothetical protein AUI83_01180 [Armatimonadetes bacterium 13_1_40CM_3_65_7]